MSELRPEQCRAARAFLGWKQDDVAAFTSISLTTIRAFENGGSIRVANQTLLRMIFESAGITFDVDDAGRMRITYDSAIRGQFIASRL